MYAKVYREFESHTLCMKMYVYGSGYYFPEVVIKIVFAENRENADKIYCEKSYGEFHIHGDLKEKGLLPSFAEFVKEVSEWHVKELDIPSGENIVDVYN